MKFKALLVAALVMIAAIGFVTTEANAQDGVVPVVANMFGVAFTQNDKMEGEDTYAPFTYAITYMPTFGVKATKGGAVVEAQAYLSHTDTFGDPTAFQFLGYGQYTFENGLTFWCGKNLNPAGIYAWENASGDVWFMFSIPNPPQGLGVKFAYNSFFLGIYKTTVPDYTFSALGADPAKDDRIPAIYAGYSKFGNVSFAINAGFQTLGLKGVDPDKKVSVMGMGGNGTIGTTVADIKFDLGAWYWINPGEMGIGGPNMSLTWDMTGTVPKAQSTNVYGGFFTVAYSIIPDFRACLAVFYNAHSNKDWDKNPYELKYSISGKYMFNPQFSISPGFDVSQGADAAGDATRRVYRFNLSFGITT